MINSALTFGIGKLLRSNLGHSELYTFDGPVEFEDLVVKGDLNGKIELMRTDKGINAEVTEMEATAVLKCEKCLSDFEFPVKIESMSREYLLKEPEIIEDPNDIFLIDKKHLNIDLKEMLRQEIILQFPAIPVCYERCKGICAHCGGNKNKKLCQCKDEKPAEYKPLAALKELYKDN